MITFKALNEFEESRGKPKNLIRVGLKLKFFLIFDL